MPCFGCFGEAVSFLNHKEPSLDPRTVGYVVLLLGTTAMFMNQVTTAHAVCAAAAVYLIAAKVYKLCAVYLAIYAAVAFLMANVDRVQNTNAMLLIVSFSYFVQKLLVWVMMGTFFVRMTTIPYVLSAMQHLKVPDAAAVPILVALRFFPAVRADYRSLKDSLLLRKISLSPVQFAVHPVRMMEYLFVPILMKSVRTSDELAASALLRGFERLSDQTILYPLKLKPLDAVVCILSTCTAAGLFYLQFN